MPTKRQLAAATLGSWRRDNWPYCANTSYFEPDGSSPYWAALIRSGGVAIHVTGEVPGLEIECWAIRG